MSVWDELADPLGERIADDLRALVRAYDDGAERSQQHHLGPSQVGNPCTRCLARYVLGCPVTRLYDDPWCRVIGTAVHEWLACAAVKQDPDRWLVEARVHPDRELLPSGGNVDLYDADTATVIDHKIVGDNPLRKYKANGPGRQYRLQAHLYGLGYTRQGIDIRNVAVAFWNRGGKLRDLYVWTEPYSEELALQGLARYRTIRDLALSVGVAVLPLLPADPDCWDCEGRDVENPTQPEGTPV